MSTPRLPGHSRTTSTDFSETSLVETVVPAASAADLHKSLDAWDGGINESSTSILPFISQRQFLFFDELVPVYVVLRTPTTDENTLKSYLGRLAINVEAYATSTSPLSHAGAPHAPPLKELLHSAPVQNPAEPVLFSSKGVKYENGNSQEYCYVAWKVDVFIGHPRSRLPKPVVYFSVGASLKPAQQVKSEVLDDEYLPSLAPLSGNLLEAFTRDPALKGIKPHLSASRITKVAPAPSVERDLLRPLQNASRHLSIFASFDFEVTGMSGYSLILNEVDLSLSDGRVEQCGPNLGSDSENTYKTGDQVALLYKLIPNNVSKDFTVPMNIHALDVRIRAKVLLSEECQPEVVIDWRTNVDIAHVLKSKLRVPDHLLGRSAHQRNVSSINASSPSKPTGPDSLPYLEAGQQEAQASGDIDIAVTVVGPERVYVAEPFVWDVFIVNRSERARRLEFQVIFKDNSIGKSPDLLLHTSRGLHIGTLAPSACKNTQIELEPFKDGILNIEALRLIDMQTDDYTDIQDLPLIVSFRRPRVT
ncbi:hypothetical protein MPH_03315 [Macrophomina phaseolina MS6]|uniref:Trafficking protein particle complex II-specific subunit 65 IgD3 domain-containing protein n=1 Tax=Macrophomina phaseolina (strain MS6) TaxID=1126212 RepID=K2S361_MACPH|nr:hypothetical protein MPH_03315 [Macrophomina phaseolina MS6]